MSIYTANRRRNNASINIAHYVEIMLCQLQQILIHCYHETELNKREANKLID